MSVSDGVLEACGAEIMGDRIDPDPAIVLEGSHHIAVARDRDDPQRIAVDVVIVAEERGGRNVEGRVLVRLEPAVVGRRRCIVDRVDGYRDGGLGAPALRRVGDVNEAGFAGEIIGRGKGDVAV